MGGKILKNGLLATMVNGSEPYGLLADCALVLKGETIDWIGPLNHLPEEYADLPVEDLNGRYPTMMVWIKQQ